MDARLLAVSVKFHNPKMDNPKMDDSVIADVSDRCSDPVSLASYASIRKARHLSGLIRQIDHNLLAVRVSGLSKPFARFAPQKEVPSESRFFEDRARSRHHRFRPTRDSWRDRSDERASRVI